MCRLYGFRANEATKVECSLVHAQNALMRQSRADLAGYSHAHGWGVAAYEDHLPRVERQAWAAYHGEHFARAAARVFAHLVLAHVRRATVGEPGPENTHPFVEGPWALIHNGTIPAFEQIRERMLSQTAADQRARIRGTTDSEHLFRLLLTKLEADPSAGVKEVLAETLRAVADWGSEFEPDRTLGLNVILTNGSTLVATRWGRGLYYALREGLYDCEICGFPHVRHHAGTDYRAVVLASEPITHEPWVEVPERTVLEVTPGLDLTISSF